MKYIKIIIMILVVIGMLLILSGCSNNYQVNTTTTEEIEETDEIITVTDKWIKRTSKIRDLYLIGTKNEVFKIEDNMFILKFNSSDIYNQIQIGKTYRITTTGMRSNLMSWYRNINSIELVEED